MRLCIQALGYPPHTLLCKIIPVDQLILERILDVHLLCRFIDHDTRQREEAAAVAHEVPQLHRRCLVFIGKFRNILRNRIIDGQKSVHLHLHDGKRGEGLRHRCHTENRIPVDRKLLFFITIAEVLLILDLSV